LEAVAVVLLTTLLLAVQYSVLAVAVEMGDGTCLRMVGHGETTLKVEQRMVVQTEMPFQPMPQQLLELPVHMDAEMVGLDCTMMRQMIQEKLEEQVALPAVGVELLEKTPLGMFLEEQVVVEKFVSGVGKCQD
tara:strand:- start:601 stop:999 length:399 start_codon:yes stop_codon:yes gene_type:complete